MRLIVEREREIEKFKTEEFWRLAVNFQNGVSAELFSKNGEKYEKEEKFSLFDGEYTVTKTSIDKEKAEDLEKILPVFQYVVNNIEKREVSRFPGPPFTTSTLQQEAGRKLFFSAKRTMQAAQRLYEEGLITYHRTDSVNLAAEAIEKCRQYVLEEFGKDYLPSEPRIYRTKSKVAQEAHEAIRPTNVKKDAVSETVGRDEARLYVLIWKKFVACQIREAIFDQTSVEILADSHKMTDGAPRAKLVVTSSALCRGEHPASSDRNVGTIWRDRYLFRANGLIRKFPGFLKVYEQEAEDKPLPEMIVGEKLEFVKTLKTQHFTGAPPRYTEAALIKTLEEKSIGRPSTYAPTISTITERNYIEIFEKKLQPTALGSAVNDFLVRYFPDILNIPFTAKMEDDLDEIANGKTLWMPVVSSFYGPFEEKLAT
ncbi:MAG: DNA topoisomerase, partial [bacterium]|nr:DNA topoisomerase [bacterium]